MALQLRAPPHEGADARIAESDAVAEVDPEEAVAARGGGDTQIAVADGRSAQAHLLAQGHVAASEQRPKHGLR